MTVIDINLEEEMKIMRKTNVKRIMRLAVFIIFFVGVTTLGQVPRRSEQGAGAGIAPNAQAKDQGEEKSVGKSCTERTVRGIYAFALTGSVIGVGPIAVSGTTTFDGEGGFSITGTINTTTLNPVLEGTFAGTYLVNSTDCTATATVTTPGVFGYTDLHFKAVIVDRGEEVRYLIINPGIVFAGATVKQ
jgi:hypothetical protein